MAARKIFSLRWWKAKIDVFKDDSDPPGSQTTERASSSQSRILDVERATRAASDALSERAERLCATQKAHADHVLERLGFSAQHDTLPSPQPPVSPRRSPESSLQGKRIRPILPPLNVEENNRGQTPRTSPTLDKEDPFFEKKLYLGSQMAIAACKLVKLTDKYSSPSPDPSISSVDTHTPSELRALSHLGNFTPSPPPTPAPRRLSHIPVMTGRLGGAGKEVADGCKLQSAKTTFEEIMETLEQIRPVHIPSPQPPEEPRRRPEEPRRRPAEPRRMPEEPRRRPAEPRRRPEEPRRRPAEPRGKPAEPKRPPAGPKRAPAEPIRPPAGPKRAPAVPIRPPAEPKRPPAVPTRPPAEPKRPPAVPIRPPAVPTRPPAEPKMLPAEPRRTSEGTPMVPLPPPAAAPNNRRGPRRGTKLRPSKADSGAGGDDIKPLVNPSESLSLCFKQLTSDDWEKKVDGLKSVRALTRHHPRLLQTKLHEVCLVLSEEVANLRSVVSCAAMDAIAELHVSLGTTMDPEAERTGRALLLKLAQTTNVFIHQQANLALDELVEGCSPSRVVSALLNVGLSHRCAAVRGSTAQHLHQLADIVGEDQILTAGKVFAERFLIAVSKMSVDAAPEVRNHGQKMLQVLARQREFLVLWNKLIPEKDRRPLQKILQKISQ